jgi:hypothetical protein
MLRTISFSFSVGQRIFGGVIHPASMPFRTTARTGVKGTLPLVGLSTTLTSVPVYPSLDYSCENNAAEGVLKNTSATGHLFVRANLIFSVPA